MPATFSLLTICGIEELEAHGTNGVSHVLSILDPDRDDPEAFAAYGTHRRTVLRFHDAVEPGPGVVLPQEHDIAAILAFGRKIDAEAPHKTDGHLLIHCHAGISRSTAAMMMLLAQAFPETSEAAIAQRLHDLREKAWPNSRMIAFADALLGRDGRLLEAARRLHGIQLVKRPQLDAFMRALDRGREIDAAIAP